MKGFIARCPDCDGTGDITELGPLPGQDPMMRKYECRSCHKFFYRILTEEQIEDVNIQKRKVKGVGLQ